VNLIKIKTERTNILFPSAAIEMELIEQPAPILWDNAGLIGLIPVERVANAVAVRRQIKKAGLEHTLRPFCFDWSAVVELTFDAAKKLVSVASSPTSTESQT